MSQYSFFNFDCCIALLHWTSWVGPNIRFAPPGRLIWSKIYGWKTWRWKKKNKHFLKIAQNNGTKNFLKSHIHFHVPYILWDIFPFSNFRKYVVKSYVQCITYGNLAHICQKLRLEFGLFQNIYFYFFTMHKTEKTTKPLIYKDRAFWCHLWHDVQTNLRTHKINSQSWVLQNSTFKIWQIPNRLRDHSSIT